MKSNHDNRTPHHSWTIDDSVKFAVSKRKDSGEEEMEMKREGKTLPTVDRVF